MLFDAPRLAGQQYFYAQRDAFPPPEANQAALRRRTEELDAMRIDVPEVGATIIVWLVPPADGADPPLWTIPDCTRSSPDLPMRSRWVELTDESRNAVRARVAGA